MDKDDISSIAVLVALILIVVLLCFVVFTIGNEDITKACTDNGDKYRGLIGSAPEFNLNRTQILVHCANNNYTLDVVKECAKYNSFNECGNYHEVWRTNATTNTI